MQLTSLLLMVLFTTTIAAEAEQSVDEQIQEALLPLPESLRAGATVVLESEPGKRTVLRPGDSQIICRADTPAPGFSVVCYHSSADALFTRSEQLTAEGRSEEESRDILSAEVNSGKLPVAKGAAYYRLAGASPHTALTMMGVFLPNATSESTGLSTEPNNYRPWLMWAGTAAAHIMIPGK